jgi:hypothetical protein
MGEFPHKICYYFQKPREGERERGRERERHKNLNRILF